MYEEIKEQAFNAAQELIETAKLKSSAVIIIGCSTSEVLGKQIGTFSAPEAAKALIDGILKATEPKKIYVAAQCCEHLNRAVVIEREAASTKEQVNVIPVTKAGGSFAECAYKTFKDPVVVEEIAADAGIDIGQTLIGMHLKKVAVPVRLNTKKIGSAIITAARTRPKFIGGCRAVYDEGLI